ncbi:MAG: acyltransferase, partial [Pseudomonadota bacterium]
YLLFPFLLRFMSSSGKLCLVLASLIVAALLLRAGIVVFYPGHEVAETALPFTRMDSLCVGALLAAVRRNDAWWEWVRRHVNVFRGVLLLGLVLMAAETAQSEALFGTALFSVLALTYGALLVTLLARPPAVLLAIFTQPWLFWLGRISYCVYLVHLPIFALMHWLLLGKQEPANVGVGSWLVTALSLAITLLLAEFSWRRFEAPLIAHGRQLEARLFKWSPDENQRRSTE